MTRETIFRVAASISVDDVVVPGGRGRRDYRRNQAMGCMASRYVLDSGTYGMRVVLVHWANLGLVYGLG